MDELLDAISTQLEVAAERYMHYSALGDTKRIEYYEGKIVAYNLCKWMIVRAISEAEEGGISVNARRSRFEND